MSNSDESDYDDDDDDAEEDEEEELVEDLDNDVRQVDMGLVDVNDNFGLEVGAYPFPTQNSVQVAQESPYKKVIQTCIQTKLWRACKFIGGEDVRTKVARKVFDLLHLEPRHKANWVREYEGEVNSLLNGQRNYAIGAIKEKCHDYYREHGRIPTLDEFKACLERTLDPTKPEDLELFTFWVDKILDAAAGNKYDWSKDVRTEMTISEAFEGFPDEDGEYSPFQVLMGPGTEGIAYATLVCAYDQWLEHFEWKAKPENRSKSIPPAKLPKNLKEGEQAFATKKWVQTLSGQKKYCGWTEEGQGEFDKYKKANAIARETDASKALEAAVLVKLKEIHGVVDDDSGGPSAKKLKTKDTGTALDTCDF